MGMQVSTTHKASLRGMCVNPAQHHQFFAIAIVKQFALVRHFARVRGAGLRRDHQPCDEQRIILEDTTKHTASFEVEASVTGRGLQKERTELRGEEYRTEGVAVFKIRRRLEGEFVEIGALGRRTRRGNLLGYRRSRR